MAYTSGGRRPSRRRTGRAVLLVAMIVLLHALSTAGLRYAALPDGDRPHQALTLPHPADRVPPRLGLPPEGEGHHSHPAEGPCAAAAVHVQTAATGTACALTAPAAWGGTGTDTAATHASPAAPGSALTSFHGTVLRC
ncbi:hypothetical protein [Streptomyces sp. HPF1205]|uniref:hypothetical protein n=1 Tax=Streptomyces sp. HPF1205 TaxID=2873262 RepID=UPI001CEC2A6F|nr:hypothetical protein [Streptomyces sp. HPF1205]